MVYGLLEILLNILNNMEKEKILVSACFLKEGYKYSGGSTMGTSYKLPDISSLLLLPDVVGYVIRVK